MMGREGSRMLVRFYFLFCYLGTVILLYWTYSVGTILQDTDGVGVGGTTIP